MDWTEILIGAAIGNVIGGAITIFVSWIFYVRAAEGLKRRTELIMRGLEEAAQEGLVKYRRNERTGEIEGIDFIARAHIGGSSDVSGTATVRHQDDASADQTQGQ